MAVAQPNFELGPVDDAPEREADSIAEQVMAVGAPDVSVASTRPQPGRKHLVSDALAQRVERARGGGERFDDTLRTQMEASFRTDFSDVRVHMDGEAETLNRELEARAFTTGDDVFLAHSKRSPDIRTMAHELTHVVQHRRMGQRATIQRQSDQPGAVTVPEITIVGAADPAAYKMGYSDGKWGMAPFPESAWSLQSPGTPEESKASYNQGYDDGKSQYVPSYGGPSVGIGPGGDEEQEPGEGPEKPDEPGEYKGEELVRYTYLRGIISQWRELRGWDPSEPCPLSHADLEDYRELYSKHGGSDPSGELPPTEAELEGLEVGEEEEAE